MNEISAHKSRDCCYRLVLFVEMVHCHLFLWHLQFVMLISTLDISCGPVTIIRVFECCFFLLNIPVCTW